MTSPCLSCAAAPWGDTMMKTTGFVALLVS
jgi:hypothetical protein